MSPKTQVRILILGTFHMGPTNDLFSTDVDNLHTEKRQQEILDVVKRLLKFSPTKLAVEVEKKHTNMLNEKYKRYLSGNYKLELNEVFQIGFRIAAASGHKKIHCIDWMEPGVAKRGAGDVYVWAKENQPHLFKNIYGWLESSTDQNADEYLSILDMYRNCNKETTLKQHHNSNINLARIKSAEEYVGMDWLLWWYQRNRET